jgi:hypothetical protein
MRKGLLVVAVIFFTTDASFAQEPSGVPRTPAAASPLMKLADATPVMLRTKEALSSGSAKVGDRVPLRVTEDVKAGNLIVIQRGAEAWGVVTAVQKKKRKGQPGSVDVAIQSVQLLSGERALLRSKKHLEGADKTRQMKDEMERFEMEAGEGKGPYGAAAQIFLLPIVPLFLLEKGEDVRLPAGTKVTAYLNGDVPLELAAYERLQPAVMRRAGPATVTIFRENAIVHYGSGNKPSVYCGKIALARLPSGGYLKIQLPPGKYSLWSNDEQALELELEAGQEVYLRMQMVAHGLTMKGHLNRVSNTEGEDETAGLRELSGKDVAAISEAQVADLQATPEKK